MPVLHWKKEEPLILGQSGIPILRNCCNYAFLAAFECPIELGLQG
jgi:hypothetical protein